MVTRNDKDIDGFKVLTAIGAYCTMLYLMYVSYLMYIKGKMYFCPVREGWQTLELGRCERVVEDTEVRKFDPLQFRSGIELLKSSWQITGKITIDATWHSIVPNKFWILHFLYQVSKFSRFLSQ